MAGAYNQTVLKPHEIEDRLRRALETAPANVVAAYLFGSVARGTPRASSDVDVAILFAHDPPATLDSPVFEIAGDLEQGIGIPTQVVALNAAPPDLVHRVLRDGKILLDRDRSARIRFEVRARNEFFDMQPIVQRYRRPVEAPRR